MKAILLSCSVACLPVFVGCGRDKSASPEITSVTSTKQEKPSIVLDLDRGIGVVALGMTKAELEAKGLVVKTAGPGIPLAKAGPYMVELDKEGKVSSIDIPLRETGGVTFLGKNLPVTATFDKLCKLVGRCSPAQHNVGGDIAVCADGRLLVKSSSPTGIVSLQLLAPVPVAK